MKKVILFDIDYTIFDTDTYRASNLSTYSLYEEVMKVLEELKEIADMGIFSQGEIAFQHRKLDKTNIKKYFLEESIHIVEDKDQTTEGIIKRYNHVGQLYLVDDRLPVLQLAKQARPSIKTLWVKRGKYAEAQEPIPGFTPDKTVLTIDQIVEFIRKY